MLSKMVLTKRSLKHSFDKWLLLHIRKTLLNMCVRVLNLFLPERRAEFPQTELLEAVYAKLLQAYRLEAFCGRFDDVPYQTLAALKDRHFLNVLELSRKVLIYLADTDRYYRQWLGFSFLLVQDAVIKMQEGLSFDAALERISGQWQLDLRGAVSQEYFNAHKEEFLNMVLANFLMNLVKPE